MKKNGFTLLRIFHTAMLGAQLLFCGVFFYVVYSEAMASSMKEHDKIFQLAVVAFAAIAFFAGNFIFKKKIQELRDNFTGSLQDKFVQYRTACLLQWTLLEAATLFSAISFMLTGNYAFLAMAGLLILLFAMMAPNKTKIALQLGIGLDEVNEL